MIFVCRLNSAVARAIKIRILASLLDSLRSRDLYERAVQLFESESFRWPVTSATGRLGLTERFLGLIDDGHHKSAPPQAKNPASGYQVVPLLPKARMRFAGS